MKLERFEKVRKTKTVRVGGRCDYLYISAGFGREIDKKWCDVYYNIDERVIVLRFRDEGDSNSYVVRDAKDGSAKQVACRALIKEMGLKGGDRAKKVEWKDGELWTWW